MGKAIRTTDLWMSYGDDDVKGKQMKEELAKWEGAKVIRILASTATNHQQKHAMELLEEEEQPHGQLFRLCDKKKTANLFGEFFTNLIDARTSPKTSAEKLAKAEDSQVEDSQVEDSQVGNSQVENSQEEEKAYSLFETRYGTKRGHAEAFPKGKGDRVKGKGKVPEGRH